MSLITRLLDAVFRETQEKVPDKVRRPPRWEGPTRELIRGNGCLQDVPMLTRYRLFKTPYGAIYIHHWHRPDADLDCHDHPWWFGVFVLSGGYVEELRYLPGDPRSWTDRITRCRLSWHSMPMNLAHRVIDLRPNTWTLLMIGPRRQDWAFYVHGATRYRTLTAYPYRVHWQIYIAQGGNPDPFQC